MATRDPYPYPKLENDKDFSRTPPQQYQEDGTIRIGPGEKDPWSRLNDTTTLSSYRRQAYYYDPKAPNDKLDFVLKCQYNHSEEFLKSQAQTLVQPETLGLSHGRVLKNRPVAPKPVTLEEKDLVAYCDHQKTTVNSAKGLAIESHHSEATNRGFSRKSDGGFFTT